jgi:NitT/TauT family transport system permease protein
LLGFLLSAAAGFVVGIATGLSRDVESAVKPLLTLIQSTPVMSIILLALIWFQTGGVPIFVSFLMSFPVVALNVCRGVREVSPEILEMARAYRIPWPRILFRIYVPSLGPYIIAAGSIALGLTWRVVIAAEVLSQPVFGIGTQLQQARVELETARMFAWTAVAVLLTGLSDGLFFLSSRAAPTVRDFTARPRKRPEL